VHAWSGDFATRGREAYPETALLKQVEGVGDLIATVYVLAIEDAQPRDACECIIQRSLEFRENL